MNGSASVPVVGSEFAKLNPPMSARAGMPLQVPVYLVEGLPRSFTDVNEAREHAGGEACKRQASVKLLQGIIALDNFELLETIEPTAQLAAGEGLQGPHCNFNEMKEAESQSEAQQPTSHIEPNPLASAVSMGVNGVFADLMYDDQFSFLEIRSSFGVHASAEGVRVATDEEVNQIDVTIVFDATIDARRNLVKQLRKFLSVTIKKIQLAEATAKLSTDYRVRSQRQAQCPSCGSSN